MAKSKLVKANEKIAEGVVGGYKKIEEGVVDGYKKIEEGAVGGILLPHIVLYRYAFLISQFRPNSKT